MPRGPGPGQPAELLSCHSTITERAYHVTVSSGLPRSLSRSASTTLQRPWHAGIAARQALCPTAAPLPPRGRPRSPFLLGLHGGRPGWILAARAVVSQSQVQTPLTGVASGRTSRSPALGEMSPSPLTSHEDGVRPITWRPRIIASVPVTVRCVRSDPPASGPHCGVSSRTLCPLTRILPALLSRR